ncbi:MAG: phosphoribosylformylglycinamidine synthase subunit PurL [Candidatus Thermoplasmatota archaeon]|nr:phosphoribosylformylglycinamidine synthase subunit PurL [Candidatus Thermoplasmatota archaeon]MBS3801129.1 phosphoribosylformylglycinamidine synthase subunit PurL [Candidatus Thermoplasmatota archaeon]
MVDQFQGLSNVSVIDISQFSDDQLISLSEEMGLALSLSEMKRIKTYFDERNRLPTDIELEALGQAWSEHSCYKSSKVPLKKYVYGIAEEKVLAREDAGVVKFDDNHYYCAALESHNHPSAVEPYGGAATGVGGIVRDIVCMGAQPIAYIDPLFFGSLHMDQNELPKGVKHPRYLFQGVIDGIRDYGNRIGVPTLSGQVYFHPGYTSNCLVNVGSIGIMKKEEMIHSSAKQSGDVYIYVGGRTGRDGIHGVTFASAELTDDSEKTSRSAVQVGDPITKEPLIHVTLLCNRLGLLQGLKDFGGGGLSCVAGELAHAAGLGAEIHLDDIPLKEEGLSPWEMWISESQERMMFVVSQKDVDRVLHICKQWDVNAVVVGTVIDDPVARVFYKGKKILDMDLEFYTGGPVYDETKRPYQLPTINNENVSISSYDLPNFTDTLLSLLQQENIASKEWVIRQYDHEVQAHTVVKPLQGRINQETHGDATVLKPLQDSFKGLAVTADVNPRFMLNDPYHGARAAIDEACRNLIAVGAKPDALLDCLNFGNPEKPERMGEFYEALRGMGKLASELSLPFMSGNVSFYNEAVNSSVPPTPEIMGIGLIDDIRKSVTVPFKQNDDLIYIVGQKTSEELSGSEYFHLRKISGGKVPRTDSGLLKKCMNGLLSVMDKKLLSSCHDISEGGLAVCITEMAIGNQIGSVIDLAKVPGSDREDVLLFSETATRWIVTVPKKFTAEFEKIMNASDAPFACIGVTQGKNVCFNRHEITLIDVEISQLYEQWMNGIASVMG